MAIPITMTASDLGRLNERYRDCHICADLLDEDAIQMSCCHHLFHRQCVLDYYTFQSTDNNNRHLVPMCPRCRSEHAIASWPNFLQQLGGSIEMRNAAIRYFKDLDDTLRECVMDLSTLPTNKAIDVLENVCNSCRHGELSPVSGPGILLKQTQSDIVAALSVQLVARNLTEQWHKVSVLHLWLNRLDTDEKAAVMEGRIDPEDYPILEMNKGETFDRSLIIEDRMVEQDTSATAKEVVEIVDDMTEMKEIPGGTTAMRVAGWNRVWLDTLYAENLQV